MEQNTQDPQMQELSKKQEKRLAREAEKQADEAGRRRQKVARKIGVWGISALAVAGIIWGMVALVNSVPANQPGTGPAEVSVSDWIAGPANAKVTLIEYSDFQCPACAYFYGNIEQLLKEFPNDLRVVYRHFPLTTIHKNAKGAAIASEAAGLQGKFWEMYRELFENQAEWSDKILADKNFITYATKIGLDPVRFENDLESELLETKVENQATEGASIGINSTPSFFVNGSKISNPRSYDEFRAIIQAAGAAN